MCSGTSSLGEAHRHWERTAMPRVLTECPHLQDTGAQRRAWPLRRSREALTTQTTKGTQLLKNNTLVHADFGESSSDASERPQRNRGVGDRNGLVTSSTLTRFTGLLSLP